MKTTAHIQFVRDTTGFNSERWLEVWSGGIRRRALHCKIYGSPLELSRVLPLLRYTVRSTPVKKLGATCRAIKESFSNWKAINAARA